MRIFLSYVSIKCIDLTPNQTTENAELFSLSIKFITKTLLLLVYFTQEKKMQYSRIRAYRKWVNKSSTLLASLGILASEKHFNYTIRLANQQPKVIWFAAIKTHLKLPSMKESFIIRRIQWAHFFQFYWCHMSIIRHKDWEWGSNIYWRTLFHLVPTIHSHLGNFAEHEHTSKMVFRTNNSRTQINCPCVHMELCICQPNPSCSHFRISPTWVSDC